MISYKHHDKSLIFYLGTLSVGNCGSHSVLILAIATVMSDTA